MARAGDAFISMLAGYQVFRPKGTSRFLTGRIQQAATNTSKSPVNLWYNKDLDKYRQGLYVGNKVFYKYLDTVGSVSNDDDAAVLGEMRNGLGLSGGEILNRFLPELNKQLERAGDTIPIASSEKGITAPQERLGPFGKESRAARPDGGADPVDIVFKGNRYQTTVTPLDRAQHHGLYGRGHANMLQDFSKYDNTIQDKTKRQEAKAQRALMYFRDRLGVFNRAIKQMQVFPMKGTKLRAPMAEAIRSNLRDAGSSMRTVDGQRRRVYHGFQVLNRQGFNRMAGNVTGFMTKPAIDFVRTALGNFGQYQNGVTYAFPLGREDRFANVHISAFQLIQYGGYIQFNRSALNSAVIVRGYDAMSSTLAKGLSDQSEYDVVSKQFASQVAVNAKFEGNEIQMMTMYNATTGGATSASHRLYPQIDMVNADRQLSKWLKTEGTKRVEDWFKSYTNREAKFVDHLEGLEKPKQIKGKTYWALPYIAIADYDEVRFTE